MLRIDKSDLIDIIYQQAEQERQVEKVKHEETGREYYAFMLRLRRQGIDRRWYLTMENPHTHERQNFKNVETFIAYLLTLIGHEELDLERYRRGRRSSK